MLVHKLDVLSLVAKRAEALIAAVLTVMFVVRSDTSHRDCSGASQDGRFR